MALSQLGLSHNAIRLCCVSNPHKFVAYRGLASAIAPIGFTFLNGFMLALCFTHFAGRRSVQLYRPLRRFWQALVCFVLAGAAVQAAANFANGTGLAQIPNLGTHVSGQRSADEGLGIAVQSDGKIVVAGRCIGSNPTYRFCVSRLNADGTLDASFNGGLASPPIPGKVVIPNLSASLGVLIRAAKVVIDSSDRIVVASTCETTTIANRFCVARLLANGAPDTSFDGPDAANPGNGSFVVPITAGNNEILYDLTLQKIDGRIVLVGECGVFSCIARLRATDGTFDDNSNDFGFLKPSAGSRAPNDPELNGRGVWRQPSAFNVDGRGGLRGVVSTGEGKLLVVGTCAFTGSISQICMTKFNRDGTFDDDFRGESLPIGNGGRLVINTLNSGGFVVLEEAFAVRQQADGRFLLQCGYFRNSSISQCLYRINSGGTIALNWSSGLPFPSEPGRVVYNAVGNPLDFAITPLSNQPGDPNANRVIALGDCSGVGGNSGATRICVTALRNGTAAPNIDGTIDNTLIGPNGDGNGTFFQSTETAASFTGNVVRGVVAIPGGDFLIVGNCDAQMCVYKYRPDGALATSSCLQDVDGDNRISAASDGLALIRAMLQLPGAPAIAPGLGYDIDGNGVLNARVDGLLFVRAMLGFRDANLTNGINIPSNARRKNFDQIGSYLRSRCGIGN